MSAERPHLTTDAGKCRDPQPNIRQSSKCCGGEEKSVAARGVKVSTGRLTQSTILGSYGLTETEQTSREPTRE